MGRRKRIRVGSGGKIRIKRSGEEEEEDRDSEPDVDDDEGVRIPQRVFSNFMETRAESQFRPGERDVETVYALTGDAPHRVDTTHSFSSEQVVKEAVSTQVKYDVETIVSHINRERSTAPSTVIKFHTHPHGGTQPSDQDRTSWQRLADRFGREWPDARILFGIHAFSREFDRPKGRSDPTVENGIRVEWRSITRDHTVRVYSPSGEGISVVVDE